MSFVSAALPRLLVAGRTGLLGQSAIGAYLLLVPLVAVATDRIGGHDLARVAQVLLGLVCALSLLPRPGASFTTPSVSRRAGLAVCVALAAMSVLQAAVPAMAAREVAMLAGLAAVALATAGLRDAVDLPARIASSAAAIYVAVVLLLVVTGSLFGQPLNRAEIFVGYDNYRFYNHVQSAALPAALLALALAPRGWPRGVAAFAAIGGFALLYAVVGRGTLVGLALGAVTVAVLFGRAAGALLRMLGLAALFGLMLFALLFWLLPLLLGVAVEFSDGYYGARLGSIEARLFLWDIARAYIQQSPWLGLGPMHYAHRPNPEAAHPHNLYLQIAAEWGLPMLLLLLAAAAVALLRFARAIRRCGDTRQRDTGIGLWLACVAIAVDGLFSGNFVMPVSQVWIAFTVGWTMAWMRLQQAGQPALVAPTADRWRRGAVLALVASQLWLAWSIRHEVADMEQHVKRAIERVPNPTMNPRFWSHGWF